MTTSLHRGAATTLVFFATAVPSMPLLANTPGRSIEKAAVELPKPTGPYAIGVSAWQLIDRSRAEEATSDPTDVRELIVHIRYPARHISHTSLAPYFLNPEEGRLTAGATGLGPPYTIFDRVSGWSYVNAPLADSQSPWPIVVFSPGLQTPLSLYTAIMEDLASQGYVVVGLTHPYASGVSILPDGRMAAQADHESYYEPAPLHAIWVQDARFVLDTLESLNTTPGWAWHGKMDMRRVAMIGHSFGGAAAASLAASDARIRAAANLDGLFWGAALQQGVAVPFLLLSAGDFENPTKEVFFSQLRAPGFDFTLNGSGHNNFSDQGVLFTLAREYVPALEPGMLGLGSIEPVRALDVTTACLRAFLDRFLNDRHSSVLSGAAGRYPELQMVRYNEQ